MIRQGLRREVEDVARCTAEDLMRSLGIKGVVPGQNGHPTRGDGSAGVHGREGGLIGPFALQPAQQTGRVLCLFAHMQARGAGQRIFGS